MNTDGLYWLPEHPGWSEALRGRAREGAVAWQALVGLAGHRLDFTMTLVLDRALRGTAGDQPPDGLATQPVRLAVLGSSTVDHLLPGIRVGGLRRGLHVRTWTPDYGQVLQALSDPRSPLDAFAPTCVLLALDARQLVGDLDPAASAAEADAAVERAVEHCIELWRMARARYACRVLQQTPVPVFLPLLGHNEHRLPGSKANLLRRITLGLRAAADADGVDLLSIDALVEAHGLAAWHDPVYWNKAKHEIRASAGPLYGDHVARLLAAQQGRASKCLVLDLDNTLWGGVIGDDGLEGIVLGQGSAAGEAHLALQRYAHELSRRGVVLAVCSKNDEANALLPFGGHPDMLLQRSDIACFVADWNDKASNLRKIAATLKLGLDSLVFVDDNPFERNIVRAECPQVAVPELPADVSLYARCVADGGWFETTAITGEDLARSAQYQANAERERSKATTTDLAGYLRSLEMDLVWQRFDTVGLQRVVQLVNKTNQFNLTTRRTTDDEIRALLDDPRVLTLQLRLKDRFGDNGLIAVVIGRSKPGRDELELDTWLMSCRVLGRSVEEATLNLVMREAARLGAARVIGRYLPSAKNGMVRDHYARLGFEPADETGEHWTREVAVFTPYPVPMTTTET